MFGALNAQWRSRVVLALWLSTAIPTASAANADAEARYRKASIAFNDCVEAYARRYARVNATPSEIGIAATEACKLQVADVVRLAREVGIDFSWDNAIAAAQRQAIRVVIESRDSPRKP